MKISATTVYNKQSLAPAHRQFGERNEFVRYDIVPPDGSGKCSVQIYELPPGKGNYPYHYHESSEEIFYIISGTGALTTPEGDRPIAAGDIIVCPPTPQGAHRIVNTSSDEKLVYIEFDTVAFPEVAHYPETNTMAVLYPESERNRFFRETDNVDYVRDVIGEPAD